MSAITGTKKIWFVLLAVTAIFGLYLRCSGTFRGLDVPYLYHPDEAKQVTALHNYLQGRYVWHTGSLFYDGYPYGLNHVDEWILRPVLPLRDFVLRTLYGTSVNLTLSTMPDTYYWARGLRILYGMIVLYLTYLAARWLFPDEERIRWLAVMLAAIAPLSVCVTHTATGDIGVDLFGALTIVMLCLYADKSQPRYLFLAGLSTGMAFGCKYNGILLGIIIAAYAALQLFSEKRFKTFVLQGLTSAAGCMLGILISTPAFLINYRQTRRDMLDNFTFIKNYEVHADFASKPFHVKAWLGLTQNTPMILQAFGWAVVILAASGLAVAIWKYFKKQANEQTPENRMDRLAVAIYSFPFIALLISLAGKPNVQPFHFSYMQIPLVLGAASCVAWLWQNNRKHVRTIAVIAGIITMTELGTQAMKENFFWQREDNIIFVNEIPETIFKKARFTGGQVIKNTYLEPGGVSAFRNRKSLVTSPPDVTHEMLTCMPVPSIPYPVDHEWIFLNGPVFPRNDRMFVVNNNTIIRKHLVLPDKPESISIGFRSSAWPAQTTINIGDDIRALPLAPNEQRILTFKPRKWRNYRSREKGRQAFIVPLEIVTKTGNLVVTILDSKYATKCYSVFGGTATNYMDIIPGDADTSKLAYNLQQFRYIETNQCNIHLASANNRSTKTMIPHTGILLPCGAYELECSIKGLAPTSTATFILADPFGAFKQLKTEQTIAIEPGTRHIIYRFKKNFAPYLCQIQIKCMSGEFTIESWQLYPDIKTIADDLKTWRETEKAPEWTKRYPAPDTWSGQSSELHDVFFDNVISLRSLEYSSSVIQGGRFSVRPVISITFHPYHSYDESALFFHFLDQSGKQVAAFDLPVRDAIMTADAGTSCPLTEKLDLPPGTYELVVGVWNPITYKRSAPSGAKLSREERSKRRIHAGTLTVTAP